MRFFAPFFALAAAAVPFLALAAPVDVRDASEIIPGKYIIQLKPDVDATTIAAHRVLLKNIHAKNIVLYDVSEEEKGGIEHEYSFGDFHGYSGAFDEATIEELRNLPEVLHVEEDTIMTTSALVTQSNVTWGLGSISSRTRGADSFIYDDTAGTGMYNYVVDTGIRLTHTEFSGRAVWGYNAVNKQNTDNAGHGTHVSGIIGGNTYGVAKKTTLVAVKVLEGNSGSTSTVIAGFNWAVNDIVTQKRQNTSVVNLSLGGPGSATWDNAMTTAWASGVLAAVASGNDGALASTRSPARSPETLCVGNVQSNDARFGGSQGSNYGPSVDIFAAGTGIISSWRTSDTATQNLTGTSMASPHVAGLVSYIRSLEGGAAGMSATDIKARVLALATPNRVTDAKESANLLAYNGNGR